MLSLSRTTLSWLWLLHHAVNGFQFDFPSPLTLRVGFVPDEPFVRLVVNTTGDDDTDDGIPSPFGGASTAATATPAAADSYEYSGMLYDLVQRLPDFAALDGVVLELEIIQQDVIPWTYNGAFDLVANDCEEEEEGGQRCNQVDMVAATFVANPDRAMRAHLTPAILRAAISTMTYLQDDGHLQEGEAPRLKVSTLAEAEKANAKVCIKEGSYTAVVFQEASPHLDYHWCQNGIDGCIEALKEGVCALIVAPELELLYREAWDEEMRLHVTGEEYFIQYVSWPIRDDLPDMVKRAMDRWILAAVANATVDELYAQYFKKAKCPVGTAGENCDLPCDPNHGRSNVQGICVCESIKWTGDDCSEEVPEDTNTIPLSFKAVAICLVGINVLAILACGTWLYYHRYTAQVRYSQPFFLLLVLLGCLISTFTIVAMMQEDNPEDGDGTRTNTGTVVSKPPHCMSIVWLYSIGFAITFGALSAKILRVYMVFKNGTRYQPTTGTSYSVASSANQGQRHRQRHGCLSFVSFGDTLLVIGAILLVDIIILSVWTAVDPLEYERTITRADQFGAPLESEGYCTCKSWKVFGGLIVSFHLVLMLAASYLCYVSRDIPTKFSESKHVAIAIVSNLQIFAVGIPILFILGADPQTGFFVRSVMIWMNDLAVVLLIFGNLMYSYHYTHPESWSDETVKRELRNTALAFTSRAEGAGGSRGLRPNTTIPASPTAVTVPRTKGATATPSGHVKALANTNDDRAPAQRKHTLSDGPFLEPSYVESGRHISSLTNMDSVDEVSLLEEDKHLGMHGASSFPLPSLPEMDEFAARGKGANGLVMPERQVSIMETTEEAQLDTAEPRGIGNANPKNALVMPERQVSILEDTSEEVQFDATKSRGVGNANGPKKGPVMPERKISILEDTSEEVRLDTVPKNPLVMPERQTSVYEDSESSFLAAAPHHPLEELFSISEGSHETRTFGSVTTNAITPGAYPFSNKQVAQKKAAPQLPSRWPSDVWPSEVYIPDDSAIEGDHESIDPRHHPTI